MNHVWAIEGKRQNKFRDTKESVGSCLPAINHILVDAYTQRRRLYEAWSRGGGGGESPSPLPRNVENMFTILRIKIGQN